MPKADYTFNTVDGALPLPPTILQLGMLLAETTARLGKHGIGVDRTILTLAGSLRHVMASMPAVTLQDAAAHWARLGVGLNALGLGYVAEFKAKFFFG